MEDISSKANKMKAIILLKNGKVIYKSENNPKIKKGWAVIKVKSCGLCGSDIQKIFSDQKSRKKLTTQILGHEFSGVIEEIEPNQTLKKGDRVAVTPVLLDKKRGITGSLSLGKDLPGGFAEYCLVPINNLRKIPDMLSFDMAALADVVAVSIHGYKLCSCPQNKNILVLGDGSVALSTAIFLDSKQNKVTLSGKNKKNINIARKLGIKILNKNKIKENSFDFVFECVGRQQDETLREAISSIKPSGKIMVLGVFKRDYKNKLCLRSLFFKEASIAGSNSYICNKSLDDFSEALQNITLNKEKFSKLITQTMPLSDFKEGLSTLKQKREKGVIKIIFNP